MPDNDAKLRKPTQVSRVLLAEAPMLPEQMTKAVQQLRKGIWHRFGALRSEGMRNTKKTAGEIRNECAKVFGDLPLDGTIRAATSLDVVNDILTYRSAAEAKVRKAIAKRANGDKDEAKRLYDLLREGRWTADNFLHRQMRKHFRHGQSQGAVNFIVRSDRHLETIENGQLVITAKVAKKYGKDIRIITTSSGKNVNLANKNLRVIITDAGCEVHYATEKPEGRPHGDQVVGVDKGYTEALVDSDGDAYGLKFGQILREFSDKTHRTGQSRGKLRALEQKHREAGRIAKADRILSNNLGSIKIQKRKAKAKAQLRTEAFKAVHAIVDKAAVVGSEDLTSPIAKKSPWKRVNRRMGFWAKGVLAEALDSVTAHRGASHQLVNAAYTSQVNSLTKRLEGVRKGDRFITPTGEVLQADHNAASNVLDRIFETEITRFMPHTEVKKILLKRSSPAQLSVNRHELEVSACQPCADKSFLLNQADALNEQVCADI